MNDKTTLLYIDDESINVMLFEINFRKYYHVISAPSGYEGLNTLFANPDISVVISDMKMPGMNGIEFITQAKREFPQKKYFILSGFNVTEEMDKALKDGLICKYLRKPFDLKQILESVEEVLK
jgi:response regulator RpfG family c-di-GMP phosphodiesterase